MWHFDYYKRETPNLVQSKFLRIINQTNKTWSSSLYIFLFIKNRQLIYNYLIYKIDINLKTFVLILLPIRPNKQKSISNSNFQHFKIFWYRYILELMCSLINNTACRYDNWKQRKCLFFLSHLLSNSGLGRSQESVSFFHLSKFSLSLPTSSFLSWMTFMYFLSLSIYFLFILFISSAWS